MSLVGNGEQLQVNSDDNYVTMISKGNVKLTETKISLHGNNRCVDEVDSSLNKQTSKSNICDHEQHFAVKASDEATSMENSKNNQCHTGSLEDGELSEKLEKIDDGKVQELPTENIILGLEPSQILHNESIHISGNIGLDQETNGYGSKGHSESSNQTTNVVPNECDMERGAGLASGPNREPEATDEQEHMGMGEELCLASCGEITHSLDTVCVGRDDRSLDSVQGEIYDPDERTSIMDSPSSFEPPWVGSVGQKGDVFYVEPGDLGSSGPPPGGTNNNHKSPLMNGGSNGHHHHQQQDGHQQRPRTSPSPHEDQHQTPGKIKKGLRNKVKGIISTKGKQVHDEIEIQNGRHSGSSNSSSNSTVRNNYRNHLQSNLPHHTVTFNDRPTGLMKEVHIFVDPHRHNYGRRATLCETLFGIVPGRFGPKSAVTNGSLQDRRIMVQGLLPGGEAYKCGQIKIGDWLMCINDLEVNFDNFDSILSAITAAKELKLTLQKLAIQPVSTPRPGVVRKSPVINEALVRLVSGDRVNLPKPSLSDTPHCVMFLTLTSSEDGHPRDDVLYQFPEEDSKLVTIRGMFLTLGHMMQDVTGDTPRSSSMLIENKLIHVGYAREGKQVLVVAMPFDRITLIQVNHIMEDIVRLLRVLYGSLKSAFSSPENHGRLNHFFTLLCQRALLKGEMIKEGIQTADQDEPFLDALPGVRSLTLPEETKVTVNNILSDFEAADFADMSEEFYDLRRAYTIMGCALFYKGYLLATHLHKEDLQDTSLFLRYYCLLTLCHEEQMGQVVVWKEVFPWRRCHVQTDPLIPGYTEPEARWFLLVVGMKNTMLAVLLEAGGCAAWAEGHPTPDPFYVDQAKASLQQLEALDITNQCELRLLSPSIPSLANVEWFLPSHKGVKEETSTILTPLVKQLQSSPKTGVSPSKRLMQPESILKKRGNSSSTPSPQSDRLRPMGRAGAVYEVESDAESHSTGNSESSTPIMDRRGRKPSAGSDESGGSGGSSSLFKGQKKKRTLLSAYDVTGLKSSLREVSGEEGSFVKLTSGCDNTLFHYVQLDSSDGIFICPTQQELAGISSSTHSELLANFHQACLTIRAVFLDTSKKQQLQAAGMSGTVGAGSRLGNVKEHGVLFKSAPSNWADPKKQPPHTHYWVVGRQLPAPHEREFYVCFHDSAQQDLVELAFKLGFGVLV